MRVTLFLCRVSNVFHRRHLSATADRLGACMSPSAEGDANSKHPQTAVLHSRRWHNAAIKTGTLLAGGFLQNSLMSGLPAAVHTHVWSVGLPLNHCSLIHTAAVLSYCKKTEGNGPTAVTQLESEPKRAMTFGERTLRFIGWMGGFYSRKAVLTRGAKTLYESCVETVDYEAFFRVCSLPDSFQSWFLIAHLHVWLCMVRLKREGRDGSFVMKQVVSTFWYDVEQRMRVLGVYASRVASTSMRELVQEFYGLTLAYDEGLLLDDRTLAAALWRNLLHDKEETDPTQLARLVEYVRRQVQHMDGLDAEQLTRVGKIKLLPFSSDS